MAPDTAPDASGCVYSLTQGACQKSFRTRCIQSEGIGRPYASGVIRVFIPQLAVVEALDSLRKRPLQHQECRVHMADSWTWWEVYILLHHAQETSLAHLFGSKTPYGARVK